MSSINRLSTVDSLQLTDLLAIYSQSLGNDAAATLTTLVAFLQGQLTADDELITQYASPNASGFNVTISPPVSGTSVWLILTALAVYAAGTITLPALATCVDNQEVLVTSTQALTALTVAGNGATVNGAPTTLAANAFFRLRFNQVNASWYRVG